MARTRTGRKPGTGWTPLQPASYPNPAAQAELDARGGHVLMNDTHTVVVTPLDPHVGVTGWVHLSIKRNDRAAVRDWRIMQRIKNESVGPDREAVELYPAESRLVDESNQYHLWVAPVGDDFAFGFAERMVGSPELATRAGARQRPFDDTPTGLDMHAGADHVSIRLPWTHGAQQ